MGKCVILVTGTPGVGKTTVSKRLAAELEGLYVNLTELAERERLTLYPDKERATKVVDEARMPKKLEEIINTSEKAVIIIDGHYAAAVTPKNIVTKIFVLRRSPTELKRLMEERGYRGQKLYENLASEILDVCLMEALEKQDKERICELDITGQSAENSAMDVLAILRGQKKCCAGCVDWLGMLEAKGILGEYLKI